jgi:isocitrate dehydrogenase
LRHIGEGKAANDVEQAVLVALESGLRTGDMMGTTKPASTTEFTQAVISNLGKRSKLSAPREYKKVPLPQPKLGVNVVPTEKRRVIGVDVYVESERDPKTLARELEQLSQSTTMRLEMISNRGAMVFPSNDRKVSLVDHFRCRFVLREKTTELGDADILALLGRMADDHRWMHVEKLQEFDGEPAFSKSAL